MPNKVKLTSSLEDYLEAIFDIIAAKETARSKDIAQRLHVKQPSVTTALRLLTEKKLINYAPYGDITLTPKGAEIAQKVAMKHDILKRFFTDILFVDDQTADKTACQIEHIVTDSIVERLTHLIEYLQTHICPRPDWETIYCRDMISLDGLDNALDSRRK